MHSLPVWIFICQEGFLDNCKDDTVLDCKLLTIIALSSVGLCLGLGLGLGFFLLPIFSFGGKLGEWFLYTLLGHWVLSIHDESYKCGEQ